MTFSEKLQFLRKHNGLSQEQVAEKLNVSRQAVSRWELGAIPDMENVNPRHGKRNKNQQLFRLLLGLSYERCS